MVWNRCAAVVLLAALAGCATRGVQQLPTLENWSQRNDVLTRLTVWSQTGRIGIRTRDEATSGTLKWRQNDRQFFAEIDGPFGVSGLRLTGTPEAVTLAGHKIETRTVVDPEQALLVETGVRVPVAGLRYWLLGVPDPARPSEITLNDDNLAAVIVQGGWTIEYPEYRRWSVNALPRRIRAQSGDTSIVIVVKDWNIAEQATKSL